MKLIYKVIKTPDTVVEIIRRDVDYISVGKRSLSYRLRDKAKFLFSIRLDEVSHLRIVEDDNYEN